MHDLIRVRTLSSLTRGHADIPIAVVDGPVDTTHAAFRDTDLRAVGEAGRCSVPSSLGCVHGTYVAGLLAARDDAVPGLCPDCPLVLASVFGESAEEGVEPKATIDDVASAVLRAVEAGARIVNLSLGADRVLIRGSARFNEAMDVCAKRGVLVIAAAGNGGRIGPSPLYVHRWVVPVAACDLRGRLLRGTNLGPSVGSRGLLAPGEAIPSTFPDNRVGILNGTSTAAPLVTGVAALLWSLRPQAPAGEIRAAIVGDARHRTSIVPPLLDGDASLRRLGTPTNH